MGIEIITKEDLEEFRIKLIAELKAIFPVEKEKPQKQWLRTNEVMELMGISMGTLQNLCINGVFHPSKVGGLNYFKYTEIEQVLNKGSE